MTDKAHATAEEQKGKLPDKALNDAPKRKAGEPPAAGPHAKAELTNPDSTPGSGLLPDPDHPADAQDSASS